VCVAASAAFITAAEGNSRSKGQNLQSYAIMPVQRVPRYLLLLRELIKWTPSSHPDRADLDLALRDVEDSARHMNHVIQVHPRFLLCVCASTFAAHLLSPLSSVSLPSLWLLSSADVGVAVPQMREAAHQIRQLQSRFIGNVDLMMRDRKLLMVGGCAALSLRCCA
jgi:hypothetical protein